MKSRITRAGAALVVPDAIAATRRNTRGARMPRILIVDDHPVYRDGLRLLLEQTADIEVVGYAVDGARGIAAAEQLRPDVVVLDLALPDQHGADVTRRIRRSVPDAVVLVLTALDEDRDVLSAIRAGVRGYLLKRADPATVIQAIRAVANGDAVFGPTIADRLRHFFSLLAASPQPFPDLTSREREVLVLMTVGLTNNEIARRLVVSPKTIRNRVSSVFAKLGVAGRPQAIARAIEAGLGAPAAPISDHLMTATDRLTSMPQGAAEAGAA